MATERDKEILEYLLTYQNATVKELAAHLYTSESSIRRDLAKLEKQQLIRRIHGGVTIDKTNAVRCDFPFTLRELDNRSEKINIARKAANLVHNHDIVFLDASTSAYNVIPFLADKANIKVITNGVKALNKLAEYNIATISTGGNLVRSSMALCGEETFQILNSINADIAFISCRGYSDDGLLTDSAPWENHIRRQMIKNSRQSYFLCTSSKVGKKYFHTLCHIDELTGIIIDNE